MRVALAVAASVEHVPLGQRGHSEDRSTAKQFGDRGPRAKPVQILAETAQRT